MRVLNSDLAAEGSICFARARRRFSSRIYEAGRTGLPRAIGNIGDNENATSSSNTLDVWREWLPEFDAETINAKYKGVSGEPMTAAEVSAWEKIHEFASRFRRADRIVMGVPMWNFSFPYKLKHLSATAPRSMSRRHLSHSFEGKATRLDLRRFRSPGSSI